jgi:hypothetical protein
VVEQVQLLEETQEEVVEVEVLEPLQSHIVTEAQVHLEHVV